MSKIIEYLLYIARMVKKINLLLEKILMNEQEHLEKLINIKSVIDSLSERSVKIFSEVEALKLSLASDQISEASAAALDELSASVESLRTKFTQIDDLNPDATV